MYPGTDLLFTIGDIVFTLKSMQQRGITGF